jgi:hypothetical protein
MAQFRLGAANNKKYLQRNVLWPFSEIRPGAGRRVACAPIRGTPAS